MTLNEDYVTFSHPDLKTDTLVGYLDQWNNGDLQPGWLDTAKAEVRHEPISAAA